MRDYLTKKELMKLRWQHVERLQQKRFAAVAQCLLPHTKAYADLFAQYSINPKKIRCVEDWHKFGLPLFKKKQYLNDPSKFIVLPSAEAVFSVHKKFLSRIDRMEKLNLVMTALFRPSATKRLLKNFYQPKMPFFSGGTESGSPTPVFITGNQKKLMEKIIEQIIGVIQDANDFKTDSVTGMNLFPYGPHLAWHATHLALDLAADLNLSTAAGGAIPTERLAAMAKAFSPKMFAGMHEYLKHRFFPVVAEQKGQLPIRALIMNGASKMTQGDREQLARAAQKTGIIQPLILDMYGASELKEDLLPECSPNAGFHHCAPLSTIIRTVKVTASDEDMITQWEFTQPEEGGYAALWTIDGGGTLFEGYLLGDHYEKITQDRCTHCGLRVERIYTVNRIKDIEAQLRLTGVVEQKIKGARINLSALRDTLLSADFVKEVQFVVDQKGRGLLIRFATTVDARVAMKKMKTAVARLEVTPKIECHALDELMPVGRKFEPFVVK